MTSLGNAAALSGARGSLEDGSLAPSGPHSPLQGAPASRCVSRSPRGADTPPQPAGRSTGLTPVPQSGELHGDLGPVPPAVTPVATVG